MFLKLMIAALVATGGAAMVGIGGNTSKTGDNKPKPQAGQPSGESVSPGSPSTGGDGGSQSGKPGNTSPGGGEARQS